MRIIERQDGKGKVFVETKDQILSFKSRKKAEEFIKNNEVKK